MVGLNFTPVSYLPRSTCRLATAPDAAAAGPASETPTGADRAAPAGQDLMSRAPAPVSLAANDTRTRAPRAPTGGPSGAANPNSPRAVELANKQVYRAEDAREFGQSVLRRGQTGENVRQLQQQLQARGYDLGYQGADGKFGPATEQALRTFQRDQQLPQTGVARSSTYQRLEVGASKTTSAGAPQDELRDSLVGPPPSKAPAATELERRDPRGPTTPAPEAGAAAFAAEKPAPAEPERKASSEASVKTTWSWSPPTKTEKRAFVSAEKPYDQWAERWSLKLGDRTIPIYVAKVRDQGDRVRYPSLDDIARGLSGLNREALDAIKEVNLEPRTNTGQRDVPAVSGQASGNGKGTVSIYPLPAGWPAPDLRVAIGLAAFQGQP
jgi:peptidoglycan hydrolase-like protein with peptidoglycan-binding domain